MANVGAYREPGRVPGLPLPRRGLIAFTVLLAVLALSAMAMPLEMLVVAGHSAAGAWRIFRDGGASMWLLLLCDLGTPVGLTVLGAFVLRGWRTPSVLLFLGAALPFAFGLLGAWAGQRMTLGAISGESVDPEQKARILAEGIGESMANDTFAGFVVCGIALVAAAAAASAVASIDVGRITREGPKAPSYGLAGAAVAGGLWFFATVALGLVRARTSGTLVFLIGCLPLLVVVPCAALAGRAAGVLKRWHDRPEASRMAGALLVAGLSALLAVLALERALDAAFLSRVLEAIAGESVDDSQRARILAEGMSAGHLAWAADALAAIFAAATFGLALAPALGGAANPATPSALVSAGLGAILVASTFALAHSRMAAPADMAASGASVAPPGVQLPVVVDTFSRKTARGASGERVVLMKDGTGPPELTLRPENPLDDTPSSASSCPHHRVTLYADRAATLAMLRARLPLVPYCSTELVLVATREHPAADEKELGPLAGFLGHTSYLDATLDGSAPAGPGTIDVNTVSKGALEIDGTRVALPLPADAANEAPPSSHGFEPVNKIHYRLHSVDTIDEIVQAMSAAEKLYADRLSGWELERVITIDDANGPAPVPSGAVGPGGIGSLGLVPGPTLQQVAVSVKGRLPSEIVQRIVRQNFGSFRRCYQLGLNMNPTLKGGVKVKFVIDPTGAVTKSADAGSDLPSPSVLTCVTKVFSLLTFPAPERGIVTVTYAMSFAPAP